MQSKTPEAIARFPHFTNRGLASNFLVKLQSHLVYRISASLSIPSKCQRSVSLSDGLTES